MGQNSWHPVHICGGTHSPTHAFRCLLAGGTWVFAPAWFCWLWQVVLWNKWLCRHVKLRRRLCGVSSEAGWGGSTRGSWDCDSCRWCFQGHWSPSFASSSPGRRSPVRSTKQKVGAQCVWGKGGLPFTDILHTPLPASPSLLLTAVPAGDQLKSNLKNSSKKNVLPIDSV